MKLGLPGVKPCGGAWSIIQSGGIPTRKLFVHPVPVLFLLLFVSVSIEPTSPVVETFDAPGLVVGTSNAHGDARQDPCTVTCIDTVCPGGKHRALRGTLDEWDGGSHNSCWPQRCAWRGGGGKHPWCRSPDISVPMAELDDAVTEGQVDRLVEILAAEEALALNVARRAIQVRSACAEGQLDAHLPVPPELFDALVLAQQQ